MLEPPPGVEPGRPEYETSPRPSMGAVERAAGLEPALQGLEGPATTVVLRTQDCRGRTSTGVTYYHITAFERVTGIEPAWLHRQCSCSP